MITTMASEEDKYSSRTDCRIFGGRRRRNMWGEKKNKNLATSFPTYPEEKCIIILFHTRLGSKAAKISL